MKKINLALIAVALTVAGTSAAMAAPAPVINQGATLTQAFNTANGLAQQTRKILNQDLHNGMSYNDALNSKSVINGYNTFKKYENTAINHFKFSTKGKNNFIFQLEKYWNGNVLHNLSF